MKFFGSLLYLILGMVNLLVAGLLIFSAYSTWISPVEYPVLSAVGLAFPAFLAVNILFILFWLVFRRGFSLFSFIAILICWSAVRTYLPVNMPSRVPENAIKVLSYNVMAFNSQAPHTPGSPNPILEYIRNSEADIICLQEFVYSSDKKKLTLADINKAWADYPYRKEVKLGVKRKSGNAVACYSKFPVLSARLIDYESGYNGSALFTLLINGDTVSVINNHLESNKLTLEDKTIYKNMLKDQQGSDLQGGVKHLVKKLADASSLRAHQADKIRQVIDSIGDNPLIVCGDFNDSPISYTHRVISKGFTDAFRQSGNGLGISYNQNYFYFRIDHILVSKNYRSLDCTVDRSIRDSDHYPIWCYVVNKK
ncbi:MAG: endonuclease/exonuclease/phosphatase family protein [Bacteroides sp.]|nr:endonuclease/exonuclease/phosphatase family protein [Bacteroides sp.]